LFQRGCQSSCGAESDDADQGDGFRFTDRLIEENAQGLLDALMVVLRPLPTDAPPLAHRVVEDFELVRGLRLAVGEARPVPYAARWVAKRIRAGETSTWRVIAYLSSEEVGVLQRAEDPTFRARRGKRRTHLYLPADLVPVETAPVLVEGADDEPQHEDVDVRAVQPAEVAIHRVPGGRSASVSGADSGFGELTHDSIVLGSEAG
jgi:hypothetical protein